jgi:Holliday junction resolvase
MRFKKVDANQSEIVKTFKALGCSVVDLSSVGRGCPDLVIGINKMTIFVEIKSSSKAGYTPHQIEWMQSWRGGTVARIDSIDAAVRLVNACNK